MFILHIDLGTLFTFFFVFCFCFFVFAHSLLVPTSLAQFSIWPASLVSFFFSFFFLLLPFITTGSDRCFGLGSLAGGPTAEGYVAVFPCTISVLVYKTWQDYRKRIEEGEEESDTMLWPC